MKKHGVFLLSRADKAIARVLDLEVTVDAKVVESLLILQTASSLLECLLRDPETDRTIASVKQFADTLFAVYAATIPSFECIRHPGMKMTTRASSEWGTALDELLGIADFQDDGDPTADQGPAHVAESTEPTVKMGSSKSVLSTWVSIPLFFLASTAGIVLLSTVKSPAGGGQLLWLLVHVIAL